MVWATSVLVVYTIFGFLILPWIVKSVARTRISKLLDRETNIRQVRFNPYVLSGTIRGLLVKDKVALLKDRNGKIEIDLPIDGNLDDAIFHFGKVIANVLVNVVTKIVTSPFTALGGLFGGTPRVYFRLQ